MSGITDTEILDAIKDFNLNVVWNDLATEPRYEVSPAHEWKPAFHSDVREAVCEWILKYSGVCPHCGK